MEISDLKVAISKRGINIFFENYRYKLNRETQTTYYLKCVRSCGPTMLTNPEITANFANRYNKFFGAVVFFKFSTLWDHFFYF